VVVKNYAALWFRSEIDLDELARLRWVMKWTLRRIAAHLGIPKTNIVKGLKCLEQSRNTPSGVRPIYS
jgi:DNA-binding transcriptional regulator LsrR (DeoR family)